MNWLSLPGIVVSSITLIKIVFIDNRFVEGDSNKEKISKFLSSLFWSGSLFAFLSIVFVLIKIIRFSPVDEFRLWIFLSVFLISGLITSFYFSKMINKMGEVTVIDGKYNIKKCERYQFCYEVTESYITDNKSENKKIRLFSFILRLFVLLSCSMVLLSIQLIYRQMTSSYDIDYPFVANEKIYLSSSKELTDQLVDESGNPVTLPVGTIFSIHKGEKFDIENKKKNKLITNEFFTSYYDSKWGIEPNQKIILKEGSQLFFERVYDRNLYRNDSKYHYTIKTIPSKSSLVLPSKMSFSVHHPAELSEKNYYEFVIGKNAEAQLEDVYLAFFAIVLFILWGIVWTITRIYSIRGMLYTICIDIGIIIFINLLLIFIDYYVSLMVAFILFIVSISIIQKRFGKFYDSYIFIKKDGEQKSISFTPLMDKSEFDLYFEDQTRNIDFDINKIQGDKEVLKLYNKAGEKKDSIKIFWYKNRWQIFSEFIKELKQKTVIFFRRFHSS